MAASLPKVSSPAVHSADEKSEEKTLHIAFEVVHWAKTVSRVGKLPIEPGVASPKGKSPSPLGSLDDGSAPLPEITLFTDPLLAMNHECSVHRRRELAESPTNQGPTRKRKSIEGPAGIRNCFSPKEFVVVSYTFPAKAWRLLLEMGCVQQSRVFLNHFTLYAHLLTSAPGTGAVLLYNSAGAETNKAEYTFTARRATLTASWLADEPLVDLAQLRRTERSQQLKSELAWISSVEEKETALRIRSAISRCKTNQRSSVPICVLCEGW